MASYYVDFENVGSLGMDGMSLLTDADTVYIFYSNKADTMKMDIVAQIYNTSAKIMFEKVEVGTPNALDFQLLTDLFCKIQNTQGKSFIISKDTGYDVAVKRGRNMYQFELWRKTSIRKAIEAARQKEIDGAKSLKEKKPVTGSQMKEDVSEAAKDLERTESVQTFELLIVNEEAAPAEPEKAVTNAAVIEQNMNEDRSLSVNADADSAADSVSEEPEALNNEASEEEPATEAEVYDRPKRSRNRSRRKNTQRRKENQNAEVLVSEKDDDEVSKQAGDEQRADEPILQQKAEDAAVQTAAAENKALLSKPVPLQLIVLDQKSAAKFQKRSGNKHTDARKMHEKPVMTSLSEEIRYLLKNQCDMDVTDAECSIVIKAVGSSSNRGEFYHCFRREMGDANGREFYLKIRSCFDSIKKLAKKYE